MPSTHCRLMSAHAGFKSEWLLLVIAIVALTAIAQQAPERDDEIKHDSGVQSEARVFIVLPGPKLTATLYRDGTKLDTEWETLWRPMCNSEPGASSQEQLLAIIAAHQALTTDPADHGNEIDSDEIEPGAVAGGGINFVFKLNDSVPSEALNAFDDTEAYLESEFDDSMTIKIKVSFSTLPIGVLGVTGANYTKISWSNSRNGLQDGMDSSDNILNWLPTGSTIPVRYNGNSDSITQETRVFWTQANFKSTVGSVSGTVGDLIFNKDLAWDFDPSDGVSGYSFQDVLVHEVGHVLGFASAADYRYKDIETLDIFRFQRTGGGHDYNPDSNHEFRVRPRLVDVNTPNDQHICDVISHEYRMSDGSPYQSSHFREQSDTIGLMDPAMALNESRYPNFFASSDLKLLDAIGYDR